MSKNLYLECYSGISGDMMVAALIDLGAEQTVLETALKSLPLTGFEAIISQVKKAGLTVCDFHVKLDHDNHDHNMDYLHGEHHHEHLHHQHRRLHHAHEHRGLKEITKIINQGGLTSRAKDLAIRIFTLLGEAEAKAHGVVLDQVHFHEVGAVDSIVDIVAVAVCLDNLDITEVIVPEIYEGRGFVRCQHGMIPVPVPAVTHIAVSHQLRLHLTSTEGELITPTGAAIVAAIKTSDQLPKQFTIEKIGIGAGKRTYDRPSLLRAMLIADKNKSLDGLHELENNNKNIRLTKNARQRKEENMSNLGENIKKLGFGLMRLPKKDDVIDVEQVKVMVDRFQEAGFTYFDTAWAYPGSEDAIRQALVERYPRESYQLATKNAAWINCKTREDAIAQFETSLKQTGAGYFDYYLIHNLGEGRTKAFDDFDMWSFVQEKKKEGLIKHVGFSFHSTVDELEEILIAHPEMEFVQLQINYADWDNPAIQSRACYELARKYKKPVIVMEPVKGGMLASPPESVAKLFAAADPKASVSSWAIRFAASLEGVLTVLSGMSDLEQMMDNLSYMTDFVTLSEAENKVVMAAQEAMNQIPLIPCTSCDYCAKVCPQDIGISGSFTAMNSLTLYGQKDKAVHQAWWLINGHGRKPASECIQCGECEKVCPQHIAISDELKKVSAALLS